MRIGDDDEDEGIYRNNQQIPIEGECLESLDFQRRLGKGGGFVVEHQTVEQWVDGSRTYILVPFYILEHDN